MSYTPTQWSAGDTVTSAKLNKMEQGIADSTTAPFFIERVDAGYSREELNKTWQEIYDALITQGRQVIFKRIVDENLAYYYPCIGLVKNDDRYIVAFGEYQYSTDDIDDYPYNVWD